MTMDPILLPVLAMLLLTTVISLLMVVCRSKALGPHSDKMDELSNRHTMAPYIIGAARRVSDNYNNLLEQPVLFYALCLTIAVGGLTDKSHLWLAWGYFALRVAHSAIHCSYNKMPHRGVTFALASLLLMIMLGKVVISVLP